MPKRRKAGSCALKVPTSTWAAHAAKADAASAGANSTCDLSASMEPTTALEAAPTKVTAAATTKSATTAAVPSRPCYGCERHGCNGNY
jgi:hypothetical protein